jgi:hypothetical protein
MPRRWRACPRRSAAWASTIHVVRSWRLSTTYVLDPVTPPVPPSSALMYSLLVMPCAASIPSALP